MPAIRVTGVAGCFRVPDGLVVDGRSLFLDRSGGGDAGEEFPGRFGGWRAGHGGFLPVGRPPWRRDLG
jgi:hypothetical protein